MNDTDLTASTGLDLPSKLHLLAAHITENPIPQPYGIFPLHSGGMRLTFYGYDMADAFKFAASLSNRAVRVEHFPHADGLNAVGRAFYSITITGAVLKLVVEVVVNPDATEDDTVESVTAFVESEMVAAESRETTAMAGAQS